MCLGVTRGFCWNPPCLPKEKEEELFHVAVQTNNGWLLGQMLLNCAGSLNGDFCWLTSYHWLSVPPCSFPPSLSLPPPFFPLFCFVFLPVCMLLPRSLSFCLSLFSVLCFLLFFCSSCLALLFNGFCQPLVARMSLLFCLLSLHFVYKSCVRVRGKELQSATTFEGEHPETCWWTYRVLNSNICTGSGMPSMLALTPVQASGEAADLAILTLLVPFGVVLCLDTKGSPFDGGIATQRFACQEEEVARARVLPICATEFCFGACQDF